MEWKGKQIIACPLFVFSNDCAAGAGRFTTRAMGLIDSHCHLETFHREGQLDAALQRAEEAGVDRFVTVGTCNRDWVLYREMSARRPGRVAYTVGLHPCHIESDWAEDVQQLASFFCPPNEPVAIGEMGLDYFHLPQDDVEAGEQMLAQEGAFRRQLDLAVQFECPIVIHSRDSFEDTARIIDESPVAWERIVFHCFSYGPDEMRHIMDRGGRASFTGLVTYKNAEKIREALRLQGIEKLMVETDAPYLAPEPQRGKNNEPAFVRHTAERCAECLDIDPGELERRTSDNARRFFNLDG